MHEAARRHRPHDIGNGHCLRRALAGVAVIAITAVIASVAAAAATVGGLAEQVEGGDEAVVAELGVLRFQLALQPVERLDVAAVDEARVLDFEAGRQTIDQEDPAAFLAPPRP